MVLVSYVDGDVVEATLLDEMPMLAEKKRKRQINKEDDNGRPN